MSLFKRVFSLIVLVCLVAYSVFGCGGGNSSSSNGASQPTTRLTTIQLTVNWAARSRAVSSPASALSAVIVLKNAAPTSGDVTLTPVLNRDTTKLTAYSQSYTSTNQAKAGTWPLHVDFHAQADGNGDVVGTADATVTIATNGTGIGDIATQGTIATVTVNPSQTISVNSTKDLAFSVQDASNPPKTLAITPGSATFTVASGADKLQITPGGTATGLLPGTANVTVTVDGKTSAPQPIAVSYPGGGTLQNVSVAGNDGNAAPATIVVGAVPTNGTGTAPDLSGSSAQTIRGGTALLNINVPQAVDAILVGVQGQADYYNLAVGTAGRSAKAKVIAVTRQNSACCSTGNSLAKKYPVLRGAAQHAGVTRQAGGVQYQALVSVPTDLGSSGFTLQVATMTGTTLSQVATQNITVNSQAQSSNKLQVSMSWTAPVDLDLHVKTPDGTEIGYDNRSGQNGGSLDLDSNAACSLDNVDIENITWTDQTPASGVYVIRPNLWSSCDQAGPFTYTIRVNNYGVTKEYTGTFQASEANQNASTDPAKLISITVAP